MWRHVLSVDEQKPKHVQCWDSFWGCCVSATLFKALACPSSPHLFLFHSYRCATMKPHARATPPGQGQTVACLTRLKSLRPLRTKGPRVGFHLFQPLTSDRIMNNTQVHMHWFNSAKIHPDIWVNTVYFVLLSHTARAESAQIPRCVSFSGELETLHVT